MVIPPRLRTKASHTVEGRAWLAGLSELTERLASAWSLRLGEPFDECHVSLVATADRAGDPLVLKVPLPTTIDLGTLTAGARGGEAAALRSWNGDGAVRLIEHDRETGAILIERCTPGHSLDRLGNPEAADLVAAELLDRLHCAEPPDERTASLSDRATELARQLPGRFDSAEAPFEPGLLDAALADLAALTWPEPSEVLLHGDFHHHNILSAARRPWLAIDPLPVVGDPAYDAVQFLLFRKGDLTDPVSEWEPVIGRFCALLGIDAERVKAWMFARLITDALAASAEGATTDELEARQGDLWTARLVRGFRV